MESIYDQTLRLLNRGHDFACYVDAVERTKRRGLPVSSHIILGLPGETPGQMLAYADVLNRLNPRIVIQRLYGWAPDEYLVAPQWNRTKAEILLDIQRELEQRDSWQGRKLAALLCIIGSVSEFGRGSG